MAYESVYRESVAVAIAGSMASQEEAPHCAESRQTANFGPDKNGLGEGAYHSKF